MYAQLQGHPLIETIRILQPDCYYFSTNHFIPTTHFCLSSSAWKILYPHNKYAGFASHLLLAQIHKSSKFSKSHISTSLCLVYKCACLLNYQQPSTILQAANPIVRQQLCDSFLYMYRHTIINGISQKYLEYSFIIQQQHVDS